MKHKNEEISENINSHFIQIVTFKVGDEKYGTYINAVQEILRLPEISKLPHSPDFIKGVINLRGQIIPVIDMRIRFGIPEKEYSKVTRAIVVKIDGKSIGMIVDSVTQVIEIQENQIEPPPDIIHGLAKRYIKGIARHENTMIIILNVDKVLTDDEFERLNNTINNKEE